MSPEKILSKRESNKFIKWIKSKMDDITCAGGDPNPRFPKSSLEMHRSFTSVTYAVIKGEPLIVSTSPFPDVSTTISCSEKIAKELEKAGIEFPKTPEEEKVNEIIRLSRQAKPISEDHRQS